MISYMVGQLIGLAIVVLFIRYAGDVWGWIHKRYYLYVNGTREWADHQKVKAGFFSGDNISIPGGAKVAAWRWIHDDAPLGNYLNDLDTIYAEIGTVKSKLARTRDDLLDEFKREGLLLPDEEKEHSYKQLLDPGYAERVGLSGIFGGVADPGPTAMQVHYPGETIRAQLGPQSLSGQRPATPPAAARPHTATLLAELAEGARIEREQNAQQQEPTLPPLLAKLGWRLNVYRDLANKVTMYRAHKAPPYSGPPEVVVRFELGDEQSPEDFAELWREFLGKISMAERDLKPKTDSVAAEELRKAMGGK